MQVAVSKCFSKHGNPNEAASKERESRAATNEWLKSMEKNQTQVDNGIIELDSARNAQVIEKSGPDHTHPTEAATHYDRESVPPPRTQSTCQSSRHESRRDPEAHDVRPVLAHMLIISPISQHKDPLDGILEALLKDCNSNVTASGSASRTISSHRKMHNSDGARIANTIPEHTSMPAHDFIDSVYHEDVWTSASNVYRNPRNASLQQYSALERPMSMHSPSTGSLYHPNRPDLGCFQGHPKKPTQDQVYSRNAWNGYDNMFERQQDQANVTSDSGEHVPFYAAMQDDLSGPSRVTNRAIAPEEYAQNFQAEKSGDGSTFYKPCLHRSLREWDENGFDEEIMHGKYHDQFADNWTPQNSDVTIFDGSRKGCDHDIMAKSDMLDYQDRGISADDEQSIARDTDQHEVGYQLFTTDIPGTHPAFRSHNIFDGIHGAKKCSTDAQVYKHDVEPALSGFWTPHKLY